MIPRDVRNRYSRQTMFAGLGEEGQAKLLNSTAVVVGCGALGTNIANFLVRAGLGTVRIIDRDFIEVHNLQRQVLFDEEDIRLGLPKAAAAERHLRQINSTICVEGIVADINWTNAERFCEGADVILDGLDNFEARFLLNDVSLKHGIPWVYGGAVGSTGMTMTIIPSVTPCYRCINPLLPAGAQRHTCENTGIIGTVPATVAAIQATEAIKLIAAPAAVSKSLTIIDLWSGTFDSVRVSRRQGCPACGGKYDFLDKHPEVWTDSYCGQSRAIQVVDSRIKNIALDRLEEALSGHGKVTRNDYLLRFSAGENDLIVFPDGRAIVTNTLDESLARDLYARHVASLAG